MADLLTAMEKEADDKLAKNPNDREAFRIKAKVYFARNEMKKAFQYVKKGIPVGEKGGTQIVRQSDGQVDLHFAKLLSDLYVNEGKWDEAIQCRELYAAHFPPTISTKHELFLKSLENLKAKKKQAEKNAEELLMAEQNLKDETEKAKKKKKKGKSKVEISTNEAEEEKETNTLDSKEVKADWSIVERHGDQALHNATTREYYLFMERENDVFVGSMGSDNSDMEDHTFIEASELQLTHYSELKELGSSNAGILYVQRRIYGSDKKIYFVVERVRPMDSVFQELIGKLELNKAKWWNLIAKLFKHTFRDIIEVLQFLYSKKIVCGNLLFGLYVTPDGRAKLLPSMDSKQTAVDDLKQLVEIMKGIISMPFGKIDVAEDPEFDLPPSLKHFLVSYSRTNTSKLVPWILKAPFFWTRDEEFKFLDGLAQLVRSDYQVKKDLEYQMTSFPAYQRGCWSGVLDGPYEAIWEKGNPKRQQVNPVPDGCFRVRPYTSGCDIYRYLCAARKHINEKEYDHLRTVKYDEDKKASDIKGYYPTIYTDSHEIIHLILSRSPQLIDCFISII